MTIARAQMYRQLYQMGGIGTLPMDFGQPLQVPQQPQPSFSSAQNITMNPLLNYGQPQLGQAGGTPLMMAGGGMSRLGYQEGGMGMDQMMQDPVNEQQGQTAILTIIQLLIEQGIDPETAKELAARILEAFTQGGEPAVEALANQLEQEEGMQEPMMMAEGGITSIDKAREILQSKAPKGEFLAYINPQEAGILKLMGGAGQDVNVKGVPSFFVKSVFKAAGKIVSGAAKAVKSVAKSPIGMIALSIAAPYALASFAPGLSGALSLGQTGILGGAIRAGLTNALIQGITTGKINPKQALISAALGGITAGIQGAPSGVDTSSVAGVPTDSITGTITQPTISTGVLESGLGQTYQVPLSTPDISGTITQPSYYSPTEYATALSTPTTAVGTYPSLGYEVSPTSPVVNVGEPQPNIFERGIASVQDFGTKLINDPLGTIGSGIKSTYQLAKDYPAETILAATTALGALTPQQPGEPDDSYQKRKTEYDAEVAKYITQYGGGSKVYSPSFYAMEGAVDPFAGRSTYAANGGRIGYFQGSGVAQPQAGGSTSSGGFGGMGLINILFQKNPEMFTNTSPVAKYEKKYRDLISTNFIDENKNGIDDRREVAYGGRIGYEYGSMPMGEPRKNLAGITELDYRAKGGFVPPIGIKEKADDIPAMLSNNEFVFTANAVRNAGKGNVNKGAQRMYKLMKQLEAGGVV